MEKGKDIQDDKIGKEEINTEIFCPFCFKYPECTINLISNRRIILKHYCYNGDIVEIQFPENKAKEDFLRSNNRYYCEDLTLNVCIKCNLFVCNNCSKEHEYEIKDLSLKNRQKN